MIHFIDDALGALKLYALHLSHPATVCSRVAQEVGAETIERLAQLDRSTLVLDAAFTAVRPLVPGYLTVTVALTGNGVHPLMVMVLDDDRLVRTVIGSTPQALADMLRGNREYQSALNGEKAGAT